MDNCTWMFHQNVWLQYGFWLEFCQRGKMIHKLCKNICHHFFLSQIESVAEDQWIGLKSESIKLVRSGFMILIAFLVAKGVWAKGTVVNKNSIEMFCFNMIPSMSLANVGKRITDSTMEFAITFLLKILYQFLRIRKFLS